MAFLLITSSPGSNQSINLPVDWNPADNSVECIGAGARGAHGSSTTTGGGGGGGGAYTKIVNISLTANTAVTVRIGATSGTDGGAGGDTWFNDTAFPTTGANKAGARGGAALASATTTTGGIGGAASSGYPTSGTGLVRNNGGNGGLGVLNTTPGGAGGAGGPGGAGVVGNAGNAGSNPRAGGAGNNGSGGAGGVGTNTASPGAAGGTGTYSGGGGGGSSATPSTGGAGGLYGGGGAGGGRTNGLGGAGAQGIIVLTWTPLIVGTLAVTEAADTISAAGNVPLLPITGTLSLTEAADTIAAAGTVASVGGGPVTYLVSSYTPGTSRNDFTGQVGLIFRADTTRPMRFDKIGLRKGTGNTGNHTVNLYAFPGEFTPVGAVLRTAEVDLTSGTVGTFYYTDISEITLTYGAPYILVAEATASDGQFWPNADGSVTLSLLDGFPVFAGHVTAGGNAQQNTANDMFYGVDLAFAASASTITGLTNVAASANGGLAVPSSTFSSAYLAANANDGSRDPTTNGGWGVGGGWNSALGSYPHTFDVVFNEFHLIHEIDVITLRDNFTVPAAPTLTDTFTSYGIVDYLVQYWDGSAYQTIATVTGNNKVWRQFTFTPVLTSKIRVSVSLAVDGYARLVEVEAWAEPAASGGITGTLAVTEAADTISAAAGLVVGGTLSRTEAADTITSTGTLLIGGTLGITEAADTISAAGTVRVSGTLGIIEAADTIVSAGVVGTAPAVGTLVLTEAPDTISAAGTVRVNGTLGVTEAADTLAATGGPRVSGTLSRTEAADTIVAAGGPVARGTLSVIQANQTLTATAVSAVGGALGVVEAADTISAAGEVVAFDVVDGDLALNQAENTLAAYGNVIWFTAVPGPVPDVSGGRAVSTGQDDRLVISGATTRMVSAGQDVRMVTSGANTRRVVAPPLQRVPDGG